MSNNIDYVLIFTVFRFPSFCKTVEFCCYIYRKQAYIQYCFIDLLFLLLIRAISIIVRLPNILQRFLLLSVQVAIIILHVSYVLFRWF